jgi:NAD(P)-dependent dehydrogenase (short-subunit alcohol dehydrogenase family)
MSPLIAFIIGAGPGVGIATARLFAKQGYKVVVGSRKPNVESVKQEGFVPVAVDIAKHETITTAFSDIESQLGGPPNVVIFNGMVACAGTS